MLNNSGPSRMGNDCRSGRDIYRICPIAPGTNRVHSSARDRDRRTMLIHDLYKGLHLRWFITLDFVINDSHKECQFIKDPRMQLNYL